VGWLGPTCPMLAAAVPARSSNVAGLSRPSSLVATSDTVTVKELALIHAVETALTNRSARLVRWTGDDAAVVRAGPLAVTSIDAIAEGVHFELSTHGPADIGWKALASALSDLAAMGAEVGEAYVSLALPQGFEGALELVGGMEELAERSGVTIAGGDVIRAPALIVSVAVTGWAEREGDLVGRDGAAAGQLVGVTGTLGGSEAGRMLLKRGERPSAELLRRHLRPEPRLAAGRALAAAGATAMIDLSDGLATDGRHVAERSGVQLRLRLADVPLAPGIEAVLGDAPIFAAAGGDDYELLVSVPAQERAAAEDAALAAGAPLTWIGETAPGRGLVLLDSNGRPVAGLAGYEHA
jgi:thiamine-monophosphate kinase